MMVPLDSKNCAHYRQISLNMAHGAYEGPVDADKVIEAAGKFFAYMLQGLPEALLERPALPHVIAMPPPSGLPADTIDSVMVADVSLTELQAMRRRYLFELDVVSNAIKAHGAVPC